MYLKKLIKSTGLCAHDGLLKKKSLHITWKCVSFKLNYFYLCFKIKKNTTNYVKTYLKFTHKLPNK